MPYELDCRKKHRITLEIRYAAQSALFDKRGEMILAIQEANPILKEWQLAGNDIALLNRMEKPTREVVVTIKRSNVIYEDTENIDSYVEDAKRIFSTIYEVLGSGIDKFVRVGCRLGATYKSRDISTFDAAKNTFKQKLLNEDFVRELPDSKDFRFEYDFKEGSFFIGPIKAKENWIEKTFKNPEENVPPYGFGMDIDTFIMNRDINNHENISAVIDKVIEQTFGIENIVITGLGL
jgi:hypothetical protein